MSASGPSLPTGYDTAKRVLTGRSDCIVAVGFDRSGGYIPRFLVQLHYTTGRDPIEWTAIARMDHNELSPTGHDVYQDGVHIDIVRRTSAEVTRRPQQPPLPPNRGRVIRTCSEYLAQNADWFVDVYEERQGPNNPPQWSPDGGSPHTLLPDDIEQYGMSDSAPAGEAITLEELSEVLAEVTDETVEEIERGAAEIELGPPWEAEPVDE